MLQAVERVPDPGKHTKYVCRCDCGGTALVHMGNLLQGKTKSCGCLHLAGLKARCTTHGATQTPEYRIWVDMWQRTTVRTNKGYPAYKLRRPPESWRHFNVFYAELGPRPGPEFSLDRIDNDKPYGPGNCRWATDVQQASNTRKNVYLEFNGVTQHVAQWARDLNVPAGVLHGRLRAGWTTERTLTTPRRATKGAKA